MVYGTVPSWNCQCKNGLSTSNPLILAPRCAPPMCWRHTMLLWTTLRLGWGCISSGEGPSSGLHGNSETDAVLDSCPIILFHSLTIVAEWKEMLRAKIGAKIGAKRPYGQNRTVRWHRPCMIRTVLFKHTVLAPSCMVQIRYGPPRRSNKPKYSVVAQHWLVYSTIARQTAQSIIENTLCIHFAPFRAQLRRWGWRPRHYLSSCPIKLRNWNQTFSIWEQARQI